MTSKKRALFSLFDQENCIDYAKELVSLGWEVIATKETSSLLEENNIATQDISQFLKVDDEYPFPPTLHPRLELILTTDNADTIDLVYITNYPLSEGNDVGGHTILALAAKGNRIPVFNKKDMAKVIEELKTNDNKLKPSFHRELIDKAHTKITEHYTSLLKTRPLAEGENPYQVPADLLHAGSNDPLALPSFTQVNGKAPCYTNMADFDCILHTMCLLNTAFIKHYSKAPYIAVAAKHGNPCGLAINWDAPEKALESALLGNPLAIFGGELIVNFPITEKLAQILVSSKKRKEILGEANWSLDLAAAPGFGKKAMDILKERKRLKLFENEKLANPSLCQAKWAYRMVRGGFLRQPLNNYVLDFTECDNKPDADCIDSLMIAWVAAWTSSHGGNEVAIAKDGMLLAAGGGPATIDACTTAIDRAKRRGHDLKNSAFAANAFFPFIDGPEALSKAGCTCGIVPAGGRYFEDVRSYFNSCGMKVCYLPEQFRGFSRH